MDYREKAPFYLDNGRAMVSLGPLNKQKYCTYSCAFCYVQNGFGKYENMDVEGICGFLRKNVDMFETIYISGDTDSFAPPRTETGLNLLVKIAGEFDKDLLFTTRAVFDKENMEKIQIADQLLKKKNRNLFACISISSPCADVTIEPFPIRDMHERVEQLKTFKEVDIFSILAMRPFLPIYSCDQYLSLINMAKGKVDCILGEKWYFHKYDTIYKRVMGDEQIDRGEITQEEMDFDHNEKIWDVWSDKKMEEQIGKYCKDLKIPFYMRSSPALDYLRTLRKNA